WSAWAVTVVRTRWVVAGLSVVALLALLGVMFDIKVGLSSTESLAKNGPAYETLQTLRRGGVSTGNLTPIEALVATDQARPAAAQLATVDGVQRAVVSADQASNRGGLSVVVLVPDRETVDSASVDVVQRVRDRAAQIPGVLGVTGVGASQVDFAHAV